MTTLPRWSSLKSPRFTSALAVMALTSLGAAGCAISSEPEESYSGPVETVFVQVLPIGSTTTNLARGVTIQLRAIPTNAADRGANFVDVPVTWESSNTAQATVDGNGLVTTISGGDVQITATAGGVTGTFDLNIQHAVSAVNITGGGVTIRQEGAVALTATVIAGGVPAVGRTVTWSTSNAAVATVSSSGVVAGLTNGTATITATSEGVSGTTQITVFGSPVIATVTITPVAPSTTFYAVGQTGTFTTTSRAGSGTEIGGTTPVWSSSAETVATITQGGVITVVGAGKTTLSATVDNGIGVNVVGSLEIEAAPALVSGAAVAVPGFAAGAFQLYAFVIPAGTTSMTITTTGGTGDSDLYLFPPGVTPGTFTAANFPPWPNTTAALRSGNSGNGELVTAATPAAGTYRVYVHAWVPAGAVAGLSLTATRVP
jgi:uncharacterized protein YjdB